MNISEEDRYSKQIKNMLKATNTSKDDKKL